MSWWDSIVDIGGDLYDGATEVISDQYDHYQKTINSDNAKNVDNLKENEPLKGNKVDGTTTVAVTGSGNGQQAGAPAVTNQIIAGVDNKLLFIGGAIIAVLLLKK